ncbi:hypothetical protein DICA0_E06106 [Diutina catenulata]
MLPQITIEYCAKCKWQNRAFWYLQELLQTFDGTLGAVTLKPVYDRPGVFGVYLTTGSEEDKPLYKRKFNKVELAQKYGETMEEDYWYDGFPDAKFLKLLVKDEIGAEVGHHISAPTPNDKLTTGKREVKEKSEKAEGATDACIDCRKENE